MYPAFSYNDDLQALGDLRDFVVDAIRGKDPAFPEEQLDALVLVYDRTALNPMVVEQVELSAANWQDFLRRPTKTLRVMSEAEFLALKKRNPKEKAQTLTFNQNTDITVSCLCILLLTVAHRLLFPYVPSPPSNLPLD